MVRFTKKLKNSPIGWMAGNSVAANMLMVVLLVGGLMCALRIKQEVFPDFEIDKVIVTVPYPGASPEEVEKGVVLAIEEAVQGLDGVKEVTSTSSEGVGTVIVEMLAGGDLQVLANDIRSAVDRITSMPEDTEEPRIKTITKRKQVISLAIYGDVDEQALHNLGENAREQMLQGLPKSKLKPWQKILKKIKPLGTDSITQVELQGIRPLEISIEISQEKLRRYNLTLAKVATKIRASSIEMPGGSIKTRKGEILVRIKERRDYGLEFASIPIITNTKGTLITLGDIATITDGFRDVDHKSTFDGLPAVRLDVYRAGNQTPIDIAKAVHKHMEIFSQNLPKGVKVAWLNDRSKNYRQRISLLLRNGAMGLVLVVILLSVFLELRLAFWVALGVPISFMGAFLFLPLLGISINMVSLFGFIIALGIVVDDAIVVGENIYSHHQRGLPFLEAAIVGTKEVAMPVVFSVLTNIVAFIPLFCVPGVMGKIFKNIPAVVVFVFFLSLLECLFILPAHLGHHKERKRWGISKLFHNAQQGFSHWFKRMVAKIYGPILHLVLKFRYITVALAIAILFTVVGYVLSGKIGWQMFPKVESDFAVLTVVLPYGSPFARTEQLADKAVKAANELIAELGGEKQALGVYADIGSVGGEGPSGAHILKVTVYMTAPEMRTIGTNAFVKRWRKKLGIVSGIERMRLSSDSGGPGAGPSLSLQLSHPSIDVLRKAGEELADALAEYAKVSDIDDGFTDGKVQYDFKIKPEGEQLGLTPYYVGRQVRNSFYGAEVLRQQRGRNEIRVMVRLPENERRSEFNIEELLIHTPTGVSVPLHTVAEIIPGRAYTSISRKMGRRVITVTANVTPQKEAENILRELRTSVYPKLKQKYPRLRFGLEGKQADMRESMQSLMIGLFGAICVVYVLLAIPFKNYIQPGIIMASIPFGIVGAVLGHLIRGYSLSILSMFGIVALSGVVVNDSLVLIDFANRTREAGATALDAVHKAGISRFRAIMLTTLTTFGGLVPMIYETSRQARFLIPMAISLGYGILFATIITLVLVPALYLIVEDIHDLFNLRKKTIPTHDKK